MSGMGLRHFRSTVRCTARSLRQPVGLLANITSRSAIVHLWPRRRSLALGDTLPTTFFNVLSPTLSDRITNRCDGTVEPSANRYVWDQGVAIMGRAISFISEFDSETGEPAYLVLTGLQWLAIGSL